MASGNPPVVCGGDEDWVLRRHVTLDLLEERQIRYVQSFMGFDLGDSVEAGAYLYNEQNAVIYRRSEHLEVVQGQWVSMPSKCTAWIDPTRDPVCYDAYDDPQPPMAPLAKTLRLDIDTRVNGENVNGVLSARSHIMVTVVFGDEPPPSTCTIPGPEDPGWALLGDQRTTWEQLDAAKITVGDRTGEDWLETLALLAQAVNDAGGCAVGPWDDEVAICVAIDEDGTCIKVDGYHAVSSGNGGYTGSPKGDTWRYGTAAACGPPTPPQLHHFTITLHQTEPKRTWAATPKCGPDQAYCANWWDDGRSMCPVRPEGHPERPACEEWLVGTPLWSFEGTGRCFARPNPYMYRCDDDAHGTLTLCSEKAPWVCNSVEVQ